MLDSMKKLLGILVLVFLFSDSVYGITKPHFDNITILEKPKKYAEIVFEDFDGKTFNLENKKSKIYLLNFWATWCTPCREEMPGLDKLQLIEGIEVFPINLEKKNQSKTKKFFENLKIKNLSIYFDPELNLVKLFNLRGVPITVILNKDRKEIARILGEFDFSDKNFFEWLSNH